MANDWDIVRFGSLYKEPSRNGLTKPKKIRGKGIKFINMGEIFAHDRILNVEADRATLNDKELENSLLNPYDLLFARQSLVLSGAGKCSIFIGDEEPVSFESHLIRVRLDSEKVIPLYYYYYFRSPHGKSAIYSITEQGAGASGIRGSDLVDLPVICPPKHQQRAIAHILGSLDDKIELNRRINNTLESMARAIFKSWFVDFDPVRENMKRKDAKAQGRKDYINDDIPASSRPGVSALPSEILDLFPDSFEETEIGNVPRGWAVGVIGDIASQALGGQWGKDKQEEGLLPAVCLRGCDMEDLRKDGYAPKAPIRFVKQQALEKRLMNERELLIAASGAGPCGRPLWCSTLIQDLYSYPVIYSNFVKRFSTPSSSYAIYLDRILYEKFLDKSIQDFITGTSVPNLDSNGLLKNCKIVVPPQKLLDLFYEQNQSIFNKLYSKENVFLNKLRDTLLPKLISGEIRVADAGNCFENLSIYGEPNG